ncbi:MAG: DUF3795 domain-containing protein [Oscillospiraceae bacterium]|nr:DUF3795 domain-containing protein [Oscillospiraceae bacterium]
MTAETENGAVLAAPFRIEKERNYMNISNCGIDCDGCRFKSERNCPGCHALEGKPFWGNCALYLCAAEKKLPHCGKCPEFPCEKLMDAHKAENPEGNGIEIENLKML